MLVEIVCLVEKYIACWASEAFEEFVDVVEVKMLLLFCRNFTVISYLPILLRANSPTKSPSSMSIT